MIKLTSFSIQQNTLIRHKNKFLFIKGDTLQQFKLADHQSIRIINEIIIL